MASGCNYSVTSSLSSSSNFLGNVSRIAIAITALPSANTDMIHELTSHVASRKSCRIYAGRFRTRGVLRCWVVPEVRHPELACPELVEWDSGSRKPVFDPLTLRPIRQAQDARCSGRVLSLLVGRYGFDIPTVAEGSQRINVSSSGRRATDPPTFSPPSTIKRVPSEAEGSGVTESAQPNQRRCAVSPSIASCSD